MSVVIISREKTGERIGALMRARLFRQPTSRRSWICMPPAPSTDGGKTLPGINGLYQLYQLFGVDIGDLLVLEKPAVLKNGKGGDKQEQTVPDQSGNH